MLAFIATSARQAFMCYGPDRPQQRIQLLDREVWALSQLGRVREAEERVDVFYSHLADSATDAFKARFAIHRLHLRSRSNDFTGAMAAYEEAHRYLDAMPVPRRAHLLLEGASLFERAEHFKHALCLAEEVLALSGREMDVFHTQATFARSRARLALARAAGPPPDALLHELATTLDTVATRFRALQLLDHYSHTLVVLGEIFTDTGEHAHAREYFAEAVRLAREEGDVRNEVLALLGRGRAYSTQRLFKQAENDLRTALALTETTDAGPLQADVLLKLGTVYKNMRRWDDAIFHYESVINEASQTFVTMQYQAREGLTQVHIARQREARSRWSYACLFFAVLSLGLISYGVFASRRSRTTRETEQPVMRSPASTTSLPARRLVYLQAVLQQPHEVAATIQAMYPGLARRLNNDRLRNRTELYSCVGALEHMMNGRELGNPEDAIRIDLARHFKRNAWSWPTSFDAWRDHFDTHPMPVLFNADSPTNG